MIPHLKRTWQQHIFTSLLILYLLVDDIKTTNVIDNDPLPVPTLIRQHGYRTETHEVVTEDGYILNLHRIPNPGKPPVLLNHGIFSSSAFYVVRGPGQSLAYVLHKAGYDVWLGNSRGNFYSRKHISLNNTQFEFWQFGIHEMGIYDLPAEIDYIMDQTHSYKINYIGHSIGAMYYWILMSEIPEYNDKINQMHALAPLAYMGNSKRDKNSILKIITLSALKILQNMKFGQVFPNTILNRGLSLICSFSFLTNFCSNQFSLTLGRDAKYVSPELVSTLINNFPSGLSLKSLEHTIQLFGTGKFSKYDFGTKVKNLKIYNTALPPEYDLTKVTSPVFIQYAKNDTTALPENVKKLCTKISNCKEIRLVPDSGFAHADFGWGTTATTLVYDYIIKILKLPPSYYI